MTQPQIVLPTLTPIPVHAVAPYDDEIGGGDSYRFEGEGYYPEMAWDWATMLENGGDYNSLQTSSSPTQQSANPFKPHATSMHGRPYM